LLSMLHRLAVCVLTLTLRVLVGLVCALLWELVVGLCTGIGALLLAICTILMSALREYLEIWNMADLPLLLLLVVWCYLLPMLETAVVGYSILLTVALLRLLLAAIVPLALWLLLGRIGRLLIATLIVTLLRRILVLILTLRRVLLIVLLVVLVIVGTGHYDLFVFEGSEIVRRGYDFVMEDARS
jgi:hypothetical protein